MRYLSIFDSPFHDSIAFSVKISGDADESAIYPEELALLSPQATPRRRVEFILGRIAAHEAIQALTGCSSQPILKGERGDPIWPEGLVGTIAHTSGIAMAAVACRENTPGLGIDLEESERKVEPGVVSRVCHAEEMEWVEAGGVHTTLRLKMIFSAKESIFKALYPVEHIFLGYKDALLAWSDPQSSFIARLMKPAGEQFPMGREFQVGCRVMEGYIFSFLCLPK